MDFASQKLECGGKLILLRFPDGIRLQVRPLSYKEFLIFQSLYYDNEIRDYHIDDLVFKTSVQDNFASTEWLDEQKAGVCRTVANLIMYLASNHYDELDTTFVSMLNAARADAQSFDNIMFTMICKVFPAYTFQTLEKLSFAEVLKLFACSEKHLLDTGVLSEPMMPEYTGAPTEQQATTATGPAKQLVIPSGEIAASEMAFGNSMDDEFEIRQHDIEMEKAYKAYMAQKDPNAVPPEPVVEEKAKLSRKDYNDIVDKLRPKKKTSSTSIRKSGKF